MNKYNSKGEKDGYWEYIHFNRLKICGRYKNGKTIGRWIKRTDGKILGIIDYFSNYHIKYNMSKVAGEDKFYIYVKIVNSNLNGSLIYMETYDDQGNVKSYNPQIFIKYNSLIKYGEDLSCDGVKFHQTRKIIPNKDFVELEYDDKKRIIRIYSKDNETFAQQKYNDKDEVIYYKDYLGNYFDLSIGNVCHYDINEIYEEFSYSLPEDDPSLSNIFSRFSNFTPQYKAASV